jgi:fatty acid amide hydrolase 2
MSFKKYLPFIAYVNTWGLPSLTVPIAENAAGLPIGLQITSRVGNEDAIFQLGQILERNFRGYKRAVI